MENVLNMKETAKVPDKKKKKQQPLVSSYQTAWKKPVHHVNLQAERAGAVQPGEEEALGRPESGLSVSEGKL